MRVGQVGQLGRVRQDRQVGRAGRHRRVGQVRQGANSRRSVGSWGRTLLVVSALGIAACSGPRETAPATEPARATEPAAHDAHIVARSGLAMGSELTLMAWTADEDVANRAFDAVFAEFDRLDKLMSVWKPDSDVVRLNAAAGDASGAGQPRHARRAVSRRGRSATGRTGSST